MLVAVGGMSISNLMGFVGLETPLWWLSQWAQVILALVKSEETDGSRAEVS